MMFFSPMEIFAPFDCYLELLRSFAVTFEEEIVYTSKLLQIK